jgi:hypothetical protein
VADPPNLARQPRPAANGLRRILERTIAWLGAGLWRERMHAKWPEGPTLGGQRPPALARAASAEVKLTNPVYPVRRADRGSAPITRLIHLPRHLPVQPVPLSNTERSAFFQIQARSWLAACGHGGSGNLCQAHAAGQIERRPPGLKRRARIRAQRRREVLLSTSRTASRSTDLAARPSQSRGVLPRSSSASVSAPCSSKTRIVCTNPAFTT